MLDNYTVETAPLFKMLGFETFRFIIVRYNHYSLVSKIQSDLQQLFPQRPTKKLDAQKIDYQSLTKTYYALEKGFLFLENFEILLKKKLDSQNRETPEIALENKRKTDILAGLNLRRDTLAKYPIALMVFVSSSADELYARTIMEQMPDMWSFRSMILDLHTNMDGEPKPITDPLPRTEDNTTIISQDLSELHHLLDLLNNAPESEQAYRLTLYPQIVKTAMDTGRYEKAYEILETWEHQIHENDTLKVWLHKADILKTYGNLHDALELLEKARKLSITRADTYNEGIFCQRIGDVHIL
ncbi:MAG: hypothetical protein QM536_07870, partial [Chitinophagaceae bacterium]|nr:hypothetical protein [Chitinophagaceae bacterium]